MAITRFFFLTGHGTSADIYNCVLLIIALISASYFEALGSLLGKVGHIFISEGVGSFIVMFGLEWCILTLSLIIEYGSVID